MFDAINSIVLLIKNKKIVEANAYAVSFYGYGDLTGLDVVGTLVPETESSGRNLEQLMEDIEKNPEKYHLQVNENITAKGDVFWIVWSNSQYVDLNGEKMMLSVGIEATDLISRQKKLESVFDNSLDGIAFLDSELELIDCNSPFMKMIGFDSKEEMIRVREDKSSAYGKYIRSFANRILDELKTKTHIRIQRDLDRYDGKSFVADVVFSTIRNLKGEFVGYAVNLRDNTDMYRKATTDRLTRINNKMHFEELADYEIKRSLRTGSCLSLILCDIDHFKKINDTYGHLCGDLVLKGITSDIKLMLRTTDIFARVGGEEFAVLLPSAIGDSAYSVAEKIRGAIEKKIFIYGGNEFKLTMSFGISEFKPGISKERSLEDLFKLADKRLYYSKNHGRNRITSKED